MGQKTLCYFAVFTVITAQATNIMLLLPLLWNGKNFPFAQHPLPIILYLGPSIQKILTLYTFIIMATFHSFSQLPPELRLQIWEASVRPTQPDMVAMHYCSMADWVEEHRDPMCTIPIIGNHDDKNRSAYKRDYGLWTACWESREVVKKAFKMRSWERRRRQLELIADRCEKLWEPAEGDECLPILQRLRPRPAVSRATDEPFHLMVRPFQDICCFSIDIDFSSCPLLKRMSMLSFSDSLLDYSCPFTDLVCSNTPKSLVFEFDPSWNTEFPKSVTRLLNELSPRGLIANLVCNLMSQDEPIPHIWLLDRCDRNDQMLLEPSSCKPSQQVHYDCDHEFVDIGLEYRSKDGRETASAFIKMLAGFCDSEEFFPGDDGQWVKRRYETKNYVGVLGCR